MASELLIGNGDLSGPEPGYEGRPSLANRRKVRDGLHQAGMPKAALAHRRCMVAADATSLQTHPAE